MRPTLRGQSLHHQASAGTSMSRSEHYLRGRSTSKRDTSGGSRSRLVRTVKQCKSGTGLGGVVMNSDFAFVVAAVRLDVVVIAAAESEVLVLDIADVVLVVLKFEFASVVGAVSKDGIGVEGVVAVAVAEAEEVYDSLKKAMVSIN